MIALPWRIALVLVVLLFADIADAEVNVPGIGPEVNAPGAFSFDGDIDGDIGARVEIYTASVTAQAPIVVLVVVTPLVLPLECRAVPARARVARNKLFALDDPGTPDAIL